MKVAVVGGGIGGLSAALAIRNRGWDVEVLEQSAEFTEVGAGLSLWPNALRALEALGVGEQVRDLAQRDRAAGIRTSSSSSVEYVVASSGNHSHAADAAATSSGVTVVVYHPARSAPAAGRR